MAGGRHAGSKPPGCACRQTGLPSQVMVSPVQSSPDPAVIAVLGLGDLVADPAWRRPILLAEDLLVLVTAGYGRVEVDFHVLPCRPGTLLRVRAGQALRCGPPDLDATVVRWTPAALHGFDVDPEAAPAWLQLTGADGDAVSIGVSQLAVDCARLRGEPATGLFRHQLAVLLLRLALLADSDRATHRPASRSASRTETITFRRLRHELEQRYQYSRRVEDYADRLGCSVRTLTRACLAVTGRSAKQVVDERVALQACRLLAATDEPVARIGHHLGFPEPTNFGRFFTREVGISPGAFRTTSARSASWLEVAEPEPIPAVPTRDVPPLVRPRPPADSAVGRHPDPRT